MLYNSWFSHSSSSSSYQQSKHKHTYPPLSLPPDSPRPPLQNTQEIRGDNMCMNIFEMDMYQTFCSTTPRPSFQVHRLHRKRLLKQAKDKARRREGMLKREMEMENLKLYMVNKSIIEENEKLRKKAMLLHQENRVLLSQLQNAKFSQNQHEDESMSS